MLTIFKNLTDVLELILLIFFKLGNGFATWVFAQ